ncbi:MAG: phospho-sugar mutase [Balneolales bacterium]
MNEKRNRMEQLESSIANRVEQWLTSDYDDQTRASLRQLIKDRKLDELTDAFYKDLEFGTGGLRGIMGVGTNRVNKYTMGSATQGLCNYLKKVYDGERIKVVIAHDNRNNAAFFARTIADIFSANEIYVYYFEGLRPTPELSFAIRELGCQSGVMLTASHNPKEYSGYKAYWNDGGQVIAPHDNNIIREVSAVTSVRQINFHAQKQYIETIGGEIDRLYIDRVIRQAVNPGVIKEQHDLGIVFSPIHGTGVHIVPEALRGVGFTNLHLVEEQCVVDGNFPTVIYPNPEEKEAMSMALEKARQTHADLVLATDPDADRVGIAVKNDQNEFVLLNGNQTGTLLFHYLLNEWQRQGKLTGHEYIVKTIVTTYLIDKIARAKKVRCYNVLTGFKFIGALMTALEGKEHFIAGAEESYGYLIGDHVRDKDAVVACTVIAEMTAYYKSMGKTLFEALREIYAEYGFYKEGLVSLTRSGKKGAGEIQQTISGLRENPPKELGGEKVILFRDYLHSRELDLISGKETVIDFPSSNVLQFITERETIVSARPSGTEPKIKFYISVNDALEDVAHYSTKEDELDRRIDAISNALKL